MTVTTKKGNVAEKVDIRVFDDTSESTLTFWGGVAASANLCKPSNTILLLTSPAYSEDRGGTISIHTETHVDVDPHMTDAYWLRGFAQNLTKREHVNQPFPEDGTSIQDFDQREDVANASSI